ncbi:MAG: nuclear transport factor 2 family protein [Pseudomonadota bacterium]|nr:nuclear transport factor 2 family protein [Pseudomonadota bacterium]
MIDAAQFTQAWIRDWNSHDLEAILSHYADNARFTSPFAKILTGTAVVEGKEGLRAYWSEGLKRRPNLRFELVGQFTGHESASIHYTDEAGRHAIETMLFDEAGKVIVSTACYDRFR